jgi:starch synthase
MNILTLTAELNPIAQAGGLGDMVANLSKNWIKQGHNPIIVLPKYGFINPEKWGLRNTLKTLFVKMGYWDEYALLWEGFLPNTNVKLYLIENNEYFDRPGIYGSPNEYADNDRRFIFFNKAAFEVCKAIDFSPDIIHSHDFHTAFALAFLKEFYKDVPMFRNTAGVYTIHNLAYQGKFNPQTALLYAGIDWKKFYPFSPFEYYGMVNAMKVGISYSDKFTTVSPNYAEEIRWTFAGEGLEGVINSRAADFIGILNGVDYSEWHPEEDNLLYEKYGINSLEKKRNNKIRLLKDFGLNDNDDLDAPLIAMVTRLAEQKGIDLVINKIEELLQKRNFKIFVLASGEYHYEEFFRYLSHRFPNKALNYIGHNTKLSHQVYAAADYFLMPSRFEPCGLSQMYALKYGTIPIVRETGGLADTVQEYNHQKQEGTGFTFWQYNADDMAFAIHRALDIYNNPTHWDAIRKNAMMQNFSSYKTAQDYIQVFQWAREKYI